MFTIDDWNAQGIGALRPCGQWHSHHVHRVGANHLERR